MTITMLLAIGDIASDWVVAIGFAKQSDWISFGVSLFFKFSSSFVIASYEGKEFESFAARVTGMVLSFFQLGSDPHSSCKIAFKNLDDGSLDSLWQEFRLQLFGLLQLRMMSSSGQLWLTCVL